jgi:hypothetical protein
MSRYVMVFKGEMSLCADAIEEVRAVTGLTVLDERPSGLLRVEWSEDPATFRSAVSRCKGWVASEECTYRLCRACHW